MSFRSAVFQLCKNISNDPKAMEIRQVIHDLTVVKQSEDDDPSVLKRPLHGDLAYIASNQRIQFLGYLLADESVEDINKTQPFRATRLDDYERSKIEEAHKTIDFFINLCIEELKQKYPNASVLLDPYSLYSPPDISDEVKPFFGSEIINNCITEFKTSRVYSKLADNDALQVLERVDKGHLLQLAAMQKKQFSEELKAISKDTETYLHRLFSNVGISVTDVLMTYSVYCYALRRSLEIAAQMIFDALLGEDMTVMSNDNIIDLLDHRSDYVYEKYVVLIQDAIFGLGGHGVGSIVLLSCDPSDQYHIKEFGVMVSMTISFLSEFGSSSKITMITVDEDLNEVHRLTDAIMSTDLGKSPVVYHS